MTIALPKAKTTPTADLATKTTLIYGPPKIGKSTFAAQFPDALFFECEPGLGELSVYKVPTYNWPDLLEACKLVANLDDVLRGLRQSDLRLVTPTAVLGAALHIAVHHHVPVYWCGSRQAACAFTEGFLRMAVREEARP